MTARGKTNNINNEWDLMEDFNNTTYDPQYPDENASGGDRLDHCRLYIRNIPKGLNDEGLRSAFSKYGTLTEVFLSKDQNKRFALVRYETPGEAKLAMTKLNNTEPLGLLISIAYKPKAQQRTDRDARDYVDRPNYRQQNNRDDTASVSSRGINSRRPEEMNMSNGEDLEEQTLDEDLDPEIKMKGIQLELERLQVQEQSVLLKKQLLHLEATRKKHVSQNTGSNRCVLPDGRVVVRNLCERNLESHDADGSFAAGAGDSLNLPALQRDSSRACVACGAPADSYCSQCAVTPYCSPHCQRKDWADRHRSVCHNLARLNRKSEAAAPIASEPDVTKIPPAAPLRRPHSPAKRDISRRDETGQSAGAKKTTPTMNSIYNNKNRVYNNNRNNNGGRKFNQANRNQNNHDEDENWGNNTVQTSPPVNKNPPHVQQEPSPKPNGAVETKPKPQDVPAVNTTPKPETIKAIATTNGVKGPGSLDDVKLSKKIVPKNYVIELLSVGDSVLLSVDANGADCRSNKPGFVCLSMHEKFETEYQNLCEVYVVDCENEKGDYTPKPGESFSYLNPEDGGWYRARSLTSSLAALIDSCKLVTIKQTDKLKILPAKYEQYPEFCCLLNSSAVKTGDNLKCTILSKLSDACKVSLENVETGASVGEGEISRWLPTVEYPQKVPANTPTIQPSIPEVPRPDVVNNTKVLLVDATAIDRAFVRPADVESQKKFDTVLQDVVLHGRNASPLKEPPMKGQMVIGKFSDGLHYRALCKRTNVKQNKYLLEYIEFGNIEITPLENIYECPANFSLTAMPSEVSLITLQCKCDTSALTPPAVEYLDRLKDGSIKLNLTIPSGEKTAASGSAVCLTVAKNNESVNRKIEEMCTPEWKKMEERGADVVESEWLMYTDLEYLELPASGCSLDILDVSAITEGTLSVCQQGLPHATNVLKDLTRRMGEYCDSELGKEPYLPKNEELCIARCLPYPQWFRAVLLDHSPGNGTANLCFLDYGNIESVPVTMIRKMLPEFVVGQPALASHVEITNFPKQVTEEMLCRAVQYMEINEEGRGKLTVTRCEKLEPGMYQVEAPGLIAAMMGK